MPAFVAINVEPEDNVEDEVDVTRRIQTEDALKLYQTALKLHAQGARSFPEAKQAYDALFESEIFKYPDAATEYERSEQQQDRLLASGPAIAPRLALETAAIEDNASESSLPQTYYLAYKNHGQFLLDRIRHKARAARRAEAEANTETDTETDVFAEAAVLDDSHEALNDFQAALDRDPSDADLWRRTARVAAFLRSARIERYCLEAAIELDDDPAVDEVGPPSLAEGFAGEQLRNQLRALGDDIALTHPIMAPYLRRQVAAALRRYLDPFPWLPNRTGDTVALPQTAAVVRLTIRFSSPSWADLGMALVRSASEEGVSGRAIQIEAPEMPDDNQLMQIEIDQQLSMHVSRPAAEEAGGASDEEAAESGTTKEHKDSHKDRSTSQSRKRSQSAAGLVEAANEEEAGGDMKRSKRIRRRETLAGEAVDANATLAEQLQPLQEADSHLFGLAQRLLTRLGVKALPALDEVRRTIQLTGTDLRTAELQSRAARDMRSALVFFKDERAKVLLSKKAGPILGLNALLEQSKAGQQSAVEVATLDEMRGLRAFVQQSNSGWHTLDEVAYGWVGQMAASYATQRWSATMKQAVVQLVSQLDGVLYRRACLEVGEWVGGKQTTRKQREDLHGLVQMLFELYLDVYERINNPESSVSEEVRTETRDRLDRWMDVASGLARSAASEDGSTTKTSSLTYRYLWACVFSTTLVEGVAREHTLGCWEGLRQFLSQQKPVVKMVMPNNAVMSEISHTAAEREISRLTTMDFFLGLFQEELKDPVAVIETLEPVLNPSSVFVGQRPVSECAGPELRDLWKFLRGSSTDLRLFLWTRLADAYKEIDYSTKVLSCYLHSIEMIVDDLEGTPSEAASSEAKQQARFVQMLKTLDEALIQALHLAVNDAGAFDIVDEAHLRTTAAALIRAICMVHVALMVEDEVRAGLATAASGSQTYHGFQNRLHETYVRAWTLLYAVLNRGLRGTEVKGEDDEGEGEGEGGEGGEGGDLSSPSDAPSLSAQMQNTLAELLDAIHQTIGLRRFCKASNKIFLRVARADLLRMDGLLHWEQHLGQVLYDLHGLKLGLAASDVEEHGCPVERLERKNALALVDKVTALASRVSMKDLLKSELKNTIEHMQQAIGSTKSTAQMIHNLRYFTEYLRRPIHALRLYEAWRGGVELDTVPATTPDTALAHGGWFFLMGMIALTKFKGVDLNRRQTPGATDDLRVGAQYLRLQLQLTPSRWDAWFRLAECSDYDLDEAVLWSADKMNKDRGELVRLQRSAIHCYGLALSYWGGGDLARTDGDTKPDSDALHDLYANFGQRMYASSREPFAMEAFGQAAENERFFIAADTLSTYKKAQHGSMTEHMVWKYAARLFRRALGTATAAVVAPATAPATTPATASATSPPDWKSAYVLSKCVWKMYQTPAVLLSERERAAQPGVSEVVRALERTIAMVVQLPKPRHGQDPVLEPHYKLLSVVDKLVRRGDLDATAGVEILQRQPYGVKMEGAGAGGAAAPTKAAWEEFVIRSLRHLRDKDNKSENDKKSDVDAHKAAIRKERARAAFAVLRESMFTKTMVMNVWKCDAERPGRHHVYTEQYVRFVTRLLVVLEDRVNLEALLRRIRKKGADFYHFPDLWQSCVISYLRLLRRCYGIASAAATAAMEDVFKAVTPEEFEILAERVSDWAGQEVSDGGGDAVGEEREAKDVKDVKDVRMPKDGEIQPSPKPEHQALSAMREAVEMKKLNGSLMKAGPIDDLIADCYSIVFAEVARGLPGEDPARLIEERHRQQRQEAERLERQEREAEASQMLRDFNLFGDKAAVTAETGSRSRAGSEGPPGGITLHVAEKMERQGSGVGGDKDKGGADHPVRRGRAAGVRRPDVLRKAEQAAAKAAAAAAARAGVTGTGVTGTGVIGTGVAAGSAGSAAGGGAGILTSAAGASTTATTTATARENNGSGRRSMRLGSASSAKNEAGGVDGDGDDGRGEEEVEAEADGPEDEPDGRRGRQRGRGRSTRSKSRLSQQEEDGEDGGHGNGDGDGDENGDENGGETAEHSPDPDHGHLLSPHTDTHTPNPHSSAASSPAGSVHDSADDESELSDVPADYDENVPASLLLLPEVEDVDMVEA
ncbi:histone gene transcriptional corepressor [Grosmannia clavigera kw1407]|uniref:Histone transcription regulator 3 homolog n=1 Tax=Grosmannia clavigera (strain kw1407 / UAMH 11150) TaxID=655863 RepID=F0XJG5_GROCL|nr:histone gene transcriptional corepressor [Grosmannia clavigera kw1407]EFX02033.1 histone gene transcriptional corepressor [Grosmannia clavigera kw1407]